MTTLRTIGVTEFLGQGIDDINFNFDTVLQVAQSTRASDNDSGICVPVLMTMGANAQRWVIPSGVVGDFVLFDHGFAIRADQFSVVGNEVVLTYVPSGVPAYAITIAWCATKGGILPPVSLVQDPDLGVTYWRLPAGRGVNVLIFDHGRLLRRDQYQVDGDLVHLLYSPSGPYDIAASWGAGGPGITAPIKIDQQFPLTLDTIHYLLPADRGETVIITDHGLVLDVQDYTIDYDQNIVQLNYTPAEPLDIAAAWGFVMDGVYIEDVLLNPPPNGVNGTFYLPTDPHADSLRLRAVLSNGSVVDYIRGTNYKLVGRRIEFLTAVPPNNSTLLGSFGSSVYFNPTATDNPEIGTSNTSVTLVRGVELNVDTIKRHFIYNPDTSLAEVQFLDGVTVIKSATFTYLGDGRIDTIVETAAGRTVTRTYVYDANLNVLDIVQTVT
jgi:hypothetical protein